MAKNSFILGATRGSVGNVVVRRSNGQTVISAKPATMANPRTFAQSENRMRVSAVGKFFSPLSSYLQQGQQGKNTLNSQSAALAAAIRQMQQEGLSAPKHQDWHPFPFQLTKGSVPPLVFSLFNQDFTHDINTVVLPIAVTEDITTLGQFARVIKDACALPVDKFQLTIVVAYQQATSSTRHTFYPYVQRVMMSTTDARPANTSFGRISFINGNLVGDPDTGLFEIAGSASYWCCGLALIISYYDGKKWVRSSSSMLVDPSIVAADVASYDANVATFMDSSATADPEGRVYLDGYTRRSSGGGDGGGGYDYDPSIFTLRKGSGSSAPTITQKAVAVVPYSLDGTSVVGLQLDDDSVALLCGGIRMGTYGKAWNLGTQAEITLTSEQQAVAVWCNDGPDGSPSYYDFYAWVAQSLGWPLSVFL